MKSVYSYIGSICLLIYIIGILFNLIKIKHTNKIMQTVLGLVLLLNIISPIYNQEFYIDINSLEVQSMQIDKGENEEYIIENAKLILENEIKEELNQKNIAYNDVTVHIHKENENFLIKEISINGSEEAEKETVIDILSEYTNKECIIFRGEYGEN